MKELLTAFGIITASFLITCLSACEERTVHSAEEMKAHKTGYPFPFITQDLSQRYHPLTYPQKFSFVSPRDTGFRVHMPSFFASWLVFFGVVLGAFYLARSAIRLLMRFGRQRDT